MHAATDADAAGDLLWDGGSNYEYDAEGRVKHSYSTGQWQYPMYNALGQRVEDYQGIDPMTLTYPIDIFGQRTGAFAQWPSQNWTGWNVYWARVAGQHISMGGADSWLAHADAIDSTTMVTDETGAWVWDQVYGPWGEIWQQTGTRPWFVFAGLRWPVNDPLYPSATREYSEGVARWMTPDPGGVKVVKLNDPQTWNMYAYVGNNPTSRNDPSGLYECTGDKTQCQEFKEALTAVQTAATALKKGTFERNRLDAVLKFYGKDDGKGPKIAFRDLSKEGAVAETQTVEGQTTITFDPKQLTEYRQAGQGETVAHEGTHGLDANRPEHGAGPFWTFYDKEYRSYQSESYVDMGLGARAESDGDRPGWAPGMPYNQHVVNMTRNAYANALADCVVLGCAP